MKLFSHILYRIFLFATAMSCFFAALTPPVRASEQTDSTYEICFEITFSDSEITNHSHEEYQEVIFVFQASDRKYLQAKYDSTTGSYIASGYVDKADEATQFRCSWKDSHSGQLLVIGIDAGSYTLTNVQVNTGYEVLKDSIIVEISETTASVNGYVLEEFDGTQVSFRVNITRGFKLPVPCQPCSTISRTIGYVFVVVAILLLIYVYMTMKKSKESDKTD